MVLFEAERARKNEPPFVGVVTTQEPDTPLTASLGERGIRDDDVDEEPKRKRLNPLRNVLDGEGTYQLKPL